MFFLFFLCIECACASKTLNAGKIIRVNGTTTLWEVYAMYSVVAAKTALSDVDVYDIIDINVR